jgi:hypothetical protein
MQPFFTTNMFESTTRRFHVSLIRLSKDPYIVLNASRNESMVVIRKKYIALCRAHHPDVSKTRESHEKMVEINRAYEFIQRNHNQTIRVKQPSQTSYKQAPSHKQYQTSTQQKHYQRTTSHKHYTYEEPDYEKTTKKHAENQYYGSYNGRGTVPVYFWFTLSFAMLWILTGMYTVYSDAKIIEEHAKKMKKERSA